MRCYLGIVRKHPHLIARLSKFLNPLSTVLIQLAHGPAAILKRYLVTYERRSHVADVFRK